MDNMNFLLTAVVIVILIGIAAWVADDLNGQIDD